MTRRLHGRPAGRSPAVVTRRDPEPEVVDRPLRLAPGLAREVGGTRADPDGDGVACDAAVSACGRYRYRLERRWSASGPAVGFVMLNPSTADHRQDDPTIRRCVGFARRWGFGGLVVFNLFALRARDPALLFDAVAAGSDPVGPGNAEHLRTAAGEHSLVLAWGARAAAVDGTARPTRVIEDLQTAGASLFCLGRCRGGAPRHPLYVRAGTAMTPWDE